MRKIPLKTFSGKPVEGTYQQLILSLLESPKDPQRGVNYGEMQTVLPIIEKVKAAEGQEQVLVEEAEWKELSERAKHFPFKISHRELLEFIEAIVDAPKCTVEEKKAAKKDKAETETD